MELGTAIKALRKALKISRSLLSERTGLSKTAIYNIEKNLSFPSRANLTKICEGLGVPESYLLVFSIKDEDISKERRDAYRCYMIPLRVLLLEEVGVKINVL